MPLHNLPRPGPVGPIPTDIRAFLLQADRRIRRYHRRYRNSACVPCNFDGAYGILQHLAAQAPAAGTLFCEWGSGFGLTRPDRRRIDSRLAENVARVGSTVAVMFTAL